MLILFFSIPWTFQDDGIVKEIPRGSLVSQKLTQAQGICEAAFPRYEFPVSGDFFQT